MFVKSFEMFRWKKQYQNKGVIMVNKIAWMQNWPGVGRKKRQL